MTASTVLVPSGVIRTRSKDGVRLGGLPGSYPGAPAYQSAPSGPAAMAVSGKKFGTTGGNSVMTPSGVIRPILGVLPVEAMTSPSVNQTLPSGPGVRRMASTVPEGRLNSVTVPEVGSSRPIRELL